MKIDRRRMHEAAGAFRRRWPSAAVSAAAVIIIAFCPLPTGGHSALAFVGGAALGGELLEHLVRLSIWGTYKTIQRIVRGADVPRCARAGIEGGGS